MSENFTDSPFPLQDLMELVLRECSDGGVHNENRSEASLIGSLMDLCFINYNTVFINLESSVAVCKTCPSFSVPVVYGKY